MRAGKPHQRVARRTLLVAPTCIEPEFRCPDSVCSSGGICLADGGRGAEALFATAAAAAANTAPLVQLRGGRDESGTIEIRRGSAYELCAPGSAARDALECEPGADAVDAQDGDLSARVLVRSCASVQCLGASMRIGGAC